MQKSRGGGGGVGSRGLCQGGYELRIIYCENAKKKSGAGKTLGRDGGIMVDMN